MRRKASFASRRYRLGTSVNALQISGPAHTMLTPSTGALLLSVHALPPSPNRRLENRQVIQSEHHGLRTIWNSSLYSRRDWSGVTIALAALLQLRALTIYLIDDWSGFWNSKRSRMLNKAIYGIGTSAKLHTTLQLASERSKGWPVCLTIASQLERSVRTHRDDNTPFHVKCMRAWTRRQVRQTSNSANKLCLPSL